RPHGTSCAMQGSRSSGSSIAPGATRGSSSGRPTATSTSWSRMTASSAPSSDLSAMPLPPGPPLPATLQTLLWIMRPLGFMEACRERYGDVFSVRFAGLGLGRTIVFVADPEAVRTVFAASPDDLRAGDANAPLQAFLGEHSLLVLDGHEHLRQRKLMSPPFHGERMRRYDDLMRESAQEQMR